MKQHTSAPLLSRIKSWQLIWLGISGWITLYSIAIITWGTSAFMIGNSQGGCFATAMTLAGVEARRFHKKTSIPMDTLQWAGGMTTDQLNQTLSQAVRKQDLKVEGLHPFEASLGFGLRAVKAGRTFVFETNRWKEPVIDLNHAKTTEENRSKIRADFAVIVSAGKPDHETQMFVNANPVKLLVDREFKKMVIGQRAPAKKVEAKVDPSAPGVVPSKTKTGNTIKAINPTQKRRS